ncbi:MAG: TolC family protein, partial [Planctomycetota bacterium]
ISIALQNSKFFTSLPGSSEVQGNVLPQLFASTSEQIGSVYDVAVNQTRTQSIPLLVDGNGNRTLPRGVLRANQVGGVEDALAEFDAIASGFINTATTDRPRNVGPNNPFNPQQFQSLDTTQQASISKRLATGGVATLRQQIIYGRNNIESGSIARQVSSEWTTSIEAQIQHPLMRNRGTMVNRIPVMLASMNEDLAILRQENLIRNLIRNVESAYWDLYVEYRNVETQMIARDSALATAYIAKRRAEGGASAAFESADAEEQYFQFQGNLQAALTGANLPGQSQVGVYGAENRLRAFMGIESNDGYLLRPIDEPTIARVEFEWDECMTEMLYRALELRETKYEIKQKELELVSARNQLLPDVNLSLLYRWVGVGDTLGPPERRGVRFPTPGASALGELTSGDYQELAVRLDIQPNAFSLRRELTRIRGAQINLARAKGAHQEKERFAVSMLSDAIRKVKSHYGQIQSQSSRLVAAERNVEARLRQFDVGDQPIDVVLLSQQEKALAQIDYYRSLAEYNKSINYVHFLKGSLLAQSNVEISEGPWAKKAYWDALERARERSAGRYLKYGVTRPGITRTGPVDQSGMGGVIAASDSILPTDPYGAPAEVQDSSILEMASPAEILNTPPPAMELLPAPNAS